MKIIVLSCIVSSLILGGCSTRAESIKATYISPMQYQSYSCDQIQIESRRVSGRLSELTGIQNQEATKDAMAFGVGMLLFWPALFAMAGTDHRDELGRLKGEYEALETVYVSNKCSNTVAKVNELELAAPAVTPTPAPVPAVTPAIAPARVPVPTVVPAPSTTLLPVPVIATAPVIEKEALVENTSAIDPSSIVPSAITPSPVMPPANSINSTTKEIPAVDPNQYQHTTDEELEVAYQLFSKLRIAIEDRDMRRVLEVTKPSEKRILQLIDAFQLTGSLEAEITQINFKNSEKRLTGELLIKQAKGKSVDNSEKFVNSIAISSQQTAFGWSEIAW